MRRGIFSAEVYKLLISSRCIFILVLLFAVKCVISANILTPKPSFTDDCYREYMTELAGPADEKTRERVFAIRAELNDIILRADEMERALESGPMSNAKAANTAPPRRATRYSNKSKSTCTISTKRAPSGRRRSSYTTRAGRSCSLPGSITRFTRR